MASSASAHLARIREQIVRIRTLADSPQLDATCAVSAWCPSEHLDHIIKVCTSVVNRLLDLDAPASKGMSLLGRIIMAIGRFPRGRGKSPERLRGARVSAADLYAALANLEEKMASLSDAHLAESRGAIIPHPRFGGLRPRQALRFTVIHNDHHLRIIDDILKASR